MSYPKKLNGLCIGVLSGDKVLFQGPADKDQGGFKQKVLHLTAITAPKLDLGREIEEKFAFAAREFLRTRLVGTIFVCMKQLYVVGKTLSFVIEKKVQEIELGYILLEGRDIIIDLLKEGLAKLRGDKINCDHAEEYKDAEVDEDKHQSFAAFQPT